MINKQVPCYQCHKKVWALKILDVIPNENPDKSGTSAAASYGAVLIVEEDFAPIKVDASYVTKHNPVAGGYYVIYEDGYKSFSPQEPFEEGYSRFTGSSFGDALIHLKAGKKVTRPGWNGKGMWLMLVPTALAETMAFQHQDLDAAPWIGMKTADSKFVPWLASQTDVLATDWFVIE